MKIRSVLGLLLAAVTAFSLTACASPAPAKTEPQGKVYFSYFDTVSYVYSYAGDTAEQFNDRSAAVSSILSDYHRLFDIYNEYTDTVNLCTVNKNAGGEPLKVDERLIEFLKYAKELAELTEGAMDITLGSVLNIWHVHREEATEDPSKASVPDIEELKEACEHTGFELLEIDEANSTVRITDPKASLDVGALGKGYATEKAAQYLESVGAFGYVLNIGGNVRAIGTKPDGSKWVTAIRNPDMSAEDYAMKINISDLSCVTSGVYERFFTVNGRQYHHIIDRDTLFPADYFASLTVLTKDSGLADALSTALFCMSYEDGKAMAEKIGGVELIWIYPDGEIRYTDGVEDMTVKQ